MSSSTLNNGVKGRWICTQIDVNQVTCEWTLPSSRLLATQHVGVIVSPLFYTENGKEQWLLGLFPRGYRQQDPDTIYLFLRLNSSGRLGIHTEIRMSIVKGNNTKFESLFKHTFEKYESKGAKLMKLSELLDPDCSEITITTQITTDTVISKKRKLSNSQLGENLRPLLEDPKFSDVTIIVGDEKFSAHKNILSARSSVFAAMFDHEEMDENRRNVVNIEDMESAVVKGMLEYIYTGEVADLKVLANGLLTAAEKYDLEVLKAACEEAICKTLVVDNAAKILVLANLYRASTLKESAMKFIKDNLHAVTRTDDYKKINDPELLREIISLFDAQDK